MAKEPSYCRHKPPNQAYIRLKGRSLKSIERYNRLKAEWLLNPHLVKLKPKASTGPFMADLCLAYLDHAEVYYSKSNEAEQLGYVCAPVDALYATLPVSEFGISE
ncbi:MAG: hypothetical protein ABL921_17365 [Pirellula sp.]